MDIKTDVLAIIDDLFMEDVSDMMDEDLFDAGVLDSMGTVNSLWNWKVILTLIFRFQNLGVMTGTQPIKSLRE